jgi:putative endonuclease
MQIYFSKDLLKALLLYNFLMNKYFIYILTNSQRSSFYVWITYKLKYRLEEHKANKIEWFPIKYKCRYLVFTEQRSDEQAALARHTEINNWKKPRQLELIMGKNPRLDELELGY